MESGETLIHTHTHKYTHMQIKPEQGVRCVSVKVMIKLEFKREGLQGNLASLAFKQLVSEDSDESR